MQSTGFAVALSLLFVTLALTVFPVAPTHAVSQTLYGCDGADGSGPATLFKIDPSTGVVTLIGSMVNDFACSAMDFSPGGTLYAGGEDSNGIVSLFTVDTSTGLATQLGESNQGACASNGGGIQPSAFMSDMSFSTSGTLFALFVTPGAGIKGNPCLGTLNTGTGAETDVGNTGMKEAGDGLATDSGNILFGADLINLYTISRSTGAATVLHPLSGGVDGNGVCSTTGGFGLPTIEPIDAMKFNAAGVLYATINCGRGFVGGNIFLAKIAITGAITVIGETVLATGLPESIDGIAWFPPGTGPSGVPEFSLGGAASFAIAAAMLPALWLLRALFGRKATSPA